MSESKHTPGPWQQHDEQYCPLEIYGDLDIEDGAVRGTQVCDVLTTPEDAKLIAAAPDLLNACQMVLQVWRSRERLDDADLRVVLNAVERVTR